MKDVDHLLFVTPDLALGVERLAALLGVEPALGGRHPDWGTANYLVSLGPGIYLEVLGPDPDAPPGLRGRLFDMTSLPEPKLLTWAAKGTDLPARVERAREAGVELGAVRDGQRAHPDGSPLRWRLTDPQPLRGDGLIPFLIEWTESPHPSEVAPPAGWLLELRGRHPEPPQARTALAALGLDLEVDEAPGPGLVARIRTPSGEDVRLR